MNLYRPRHDGRASATSDRLGQSDCRDCRDALAGPCLAGRGCPGPALGHDPACLRGHAGPGHDSALCPDLDHLDLGPGPHRTRGCPRSRADRAAPHPEPWAGMH